MNGIQARNTLFPTLVARVSRVVDRARLSSALANRLPIIRSVQLIFGPSTRFNRQPQQTQYHDVTT